MLSPEVETTLNRAMELASLKKSEFVTLEHLLLALLETSSVKQFLQEQDVDTTDLSEQITEFIQNNTPLSQEGAPEFSLAIHRLLQRSVIHVQSSGRPQVDIEHLFAALFAESQSHACYFLKKNGVDELDTKRWASGSEQDSEEAEPQETTAKKSSSKKKVNAVEKFTTNLTALAQAGALDPIVGREDTLERTIQVLCRRTKNNPLLIGPPGVGKTALASGLALCLMSVPDSHPLFGAKVFSLDLASVLAGAKYRGDFEERIKNVLKALKEIPKSILFVDEVHTLVGAGSTGGGSMDAANLLKPYLAQGQLRCIGATTNKEYRQHFEKDSALNRRFQRIEIKEPSEQETLRILKGLKTHFEDHHQVSVSSEVLNHIVDLAGKHLHQRSFPDKAIDVLDEAGAYVRLLEKQEEIQENHVDHVVAKMTGVPLQTVSSSDNQKLKTLELRLKSMIYGQDDVIKSLVQALKTNRVGLSGKNRPIGSFLFTGPTGVGKTEICKQLSRHLGVELKRFDMSEYMEKHSVARLIGAPPGYVGYEDGGLLPQAVESSPFCVLLLDEVEKAHPDLLNVLLQIMDNGTLTDAHGRISHFENCILIMTSNLGARESRNSIGFHPNSAQSSLGAVKKHFAPEFVNRLDEVIAFSPLSEAIIRQVVEKFLLEFKETLKERHVEVNWSDDVVHFLVQKGFDPEYGARPMHRTIQKYLKSPLTDELLFGALTEAGTVSFSMEKGQPKFKVSSKTKQGPKKSSTKKVTVKS